MRVRIGWLGLAVSVTTGLAGCSSPADVPERPVRVPALSVLFIGNSLTTFNDLPGLISALADSAGVGPVSVLDVSVGGYGLEDHWITTRTRNAISQGGWDLVVLQQGPSATEGRPSLLEYSHLFAGEARATGAEVALYMVWPARERFGDFDGVFDSYYTAAENENALFFPAGEAWRVAWESDPDLSLYGPDDFHPSAYGTYLAGLVLFEQITAVSPVGLPSDLWTEGKIRYRIEPDTGRKLQDAAAEANRRYARTVPGWPPEIEEQEAAGRSPER